MFAPTITLLFRLHVLLNWDETGRGNSFDYTHPLLICVDDV
jgi:hypothetical protein